MIQIMMILSVSVRWIIFAGLSSVTLAGLDIYKDNDWNENIRVVGIEFATYAEF